MKWEIKEIIVILVIFGIILASMAAAVPFIQHSPECVNCKVNNTTGMVTLHE